MPSSPQGPPAARSDGHKNSDRREGMTKRTPEEPLKRHGDDLCPGSLSSGANPPDRRTSSARSHRATGKVTAIHGNLPHLFT